MERERYGRGSSGGGGINRYPDVSGRTRSAPPPRDDRNYSRGGDRPASAPVARSSNEPWSDVPPELEALLRAQVAQKPQAGRPARANEPAATERSNEPAATDEAAGVVEGPAEAPVETGEPTATARAKPRATRKTSTSASAAKAPAKPRAPRKTAASSASTVSSSDGDATGGGNDTGLAGSTDGVSEKPATKAPAKPRATRKPAAAKSTAAPAATDDAAASDDVAAAPKRRTTRKTPAAVEPVEPV